MNNDNNEGAVPIPSLDVNRCIATLKGWTNIVEAAGSLLGKPPEGIPCARDQALIPDWTGDWKACAELMVEVVSECHLSLNITPRLFMDNYEDQDKNSLVRRKICFAALNAIRDKQTSDNRIQVNRIHLITKEQNA